jgi:hypothetical protein
MVKEAHRVEPWQTQISPNPASGAVCYTGARFGTGVAGAALLEFGCPIMAGDYS